MALSIAGRMVTGPTSLSEPARMTLAFIDGGMEWTSWATRSPSNRFDFPDERAFLDGVQKGLHTTATTYLPRIGAYVGPLKLLSLGTEDLRTLAQYEGEPSGSDALLADAVQHVLVRHSILTAHDFSTLPLWLKALGVGDTALFATLGLDDAILLRRLAIQDQAHSESLRREAADFSLQNARSPAEFVDYYRFYLERPTQPGSTPESRAQEALVAMHALLPNLFEALGGPEVAEIPSPDQLRYLLGSWFAAGRTIGFSRISLALQQIARSAGTIADGPAGRDATRRLLSSSTEFLTQHGNKIGLMGQDGNTVRFPIETADTYAVIEVRNGLVSLAAFDRARMRSADAATSNHVTDTPAQPTGGVAEQSSGRTFPAAHPDRALPTSPLRSGEAIRAANAAVEQALAASDAAIRAALAAHSQAVTAAEDAMRRSDEAHSEAERRARAAIEEAQQREA